MVQCAIKFDQPEGIYYSGSIVNGRVEIHLKDYTKVRGILIVILGEAKVRWSESESYGKGEDRKTREVTYHATDTYIHTTTYLHGSPDGSTLTINPGSYVYNFSCALPSQIPPSIEGHIGKIRYSAKVVFDRPWEFDMTFTAGFTVLRTTDLNLMDPSIRLPSTEEVHKQFWCWPCATKPLILEATIPQSGFVCGQNIPVTINLMNQSGKKVEYIEVILKKMMKCQSDYPCKNTKYKGVIVKRKVIEQLKNEPKETMLCNILVPPIPSSSGVECRIIRIYYKLIIEAHIGGPHFNPDLEIPIKIGNVPLFNYKIYDYNNSLQEVINTTPSAPPGDTQSFETPVNSASHFGLPPPTYEEALYMKKANLNEEEEHPIAESKFLPRYPVYHFQPSAPAPDIKNHYLPAY